MRIRRGLDLRRMACAGTILGSFNFKKKASESTVLVSNKVMHNGKVRFSPLLYGAGQNF